MTLSVGAEPTARRRPRLSTLARAGLIRLPVLVIAGMALGSALTLIGVDVPPLVPNEAHTPSFVPDPFPDVSTVAFVAVAWGMSVLVNAGFGPFRLMSLWVLASVVVADYALLGGGQLAAHLGTDVDAAPVGRVVAPAAATPAADEPMPVLTLTSDL
ncbi:hypothetical protein ACGFNU_11300 [Spirillospora sp. NPDC048911]|uniref:hypothetical protein n=1 Tax=Spirillospora sp. NPDC048911 TaxID=3364527 RepID=UPI003717C2CA